MVLVVSMSLAKSFASKAACKRPILPLGSCNSKRTASAACDTDMGGGPFLAEAGSGGNNKAAEVAAVVAIKLRRDGCLGRAATDETSSTLDGGICVQAVAHDQVTRQSSSSRQ